MLYSQERFLMGQDKLAVTCGGLFQDSGGENGSYGRNENESIVICADNTSGTHVRITFTGSDIFPGDVLCFYDGNNADAPPLTCSSDFFPGSPFVIQATAANNSGCLTVTFNSDGFIQGFGWNATIDCIAACQLIQVALESSEPAANPIDTGWIDACIGERIFFEGKGLFPQNGLVYEHSAATSTFEWDFGDGVTASGPSVSHVYKKSGGYKAELTVTDQFGCKSSNFITQRVRVSTKPVFSIQDNFPKEVCVGDVLELNSGLAGGTEPVNITVATTQGTFQTRGSRSDSLALPDGNGRSYETSITFTDYSPGAVLTSVEDLKSICLTMEHSWLHDMEISMSCPNGKTVVLQKQELINDEVFLGIPNDDDGVDPLPGIGKEYCWSPTATFGTLTGYANRENNSGLGEPYFLPEGDYNTFEPFTQLIGCPLNGEWTIRVTDLWEQDNGWIFSWGIEFDPALIPQLEVYQPQVATFQWADHPTIIQKDPPDAPMRIQAIPTTPGKTSYVFETTDDYGCKSDTSIQITVLPENHEDCINCSNNLFVIDELTLCEGEETNLGAYVQPDALDAITFENQAITPFGESTGEATVTSTLEIQGISPNTISSSLEELVAVCVDLETSFTGDITLFLRAPSGDVITLTKENGGDTNDFIQTCFSPKATIPIQSSKGPFTGVFAPEDSFNTLEGENINETWSLIASGNPSLIESYTLKSWSISFQGESNATFTWRPGNNITNTIGINTILSSQDNSTPFYILSKEEEGCIVEDTLPITIIPTSISMEVNYYNVEDGEVLFFWNAVTDAISYEVSLDGINWNPTDDQFFHRESGLQNGESKTFQFRAIFDNQNCASTPTPIVANYLFCDLEAVSLEQNPTVKCAGNKDATLEIRASGGTPPYQFVLNDSLTQDNGTFNNLGAGNYQILVFDQDQICGDTLAITIASPDSIGVEFAISPPNCSVQENATLIATPFGGVGGFQNFSWEGLTSTQRELTDLPAGQYIFSAEDANGCPIRDTALVQAPLPLELTATQNPVSCFEMADGSAGVKVKGGTPNYRYEWPDGQSTPDAIGLDIGIYTVTVSDANGCSETIQTEVTQPPPIEIQFEATPISCAKEEDASIVAEASGGIGPPYKYRWENNQSNKLNFGLGIGTYVVTVTDGSGCEAIAAAEITPTSPIIASPIIIAPRCAGTSTGSIEINATGGTAPYTYVWNDSLEQTTRIATALKAGDYLVMITDSLGCESQLPVTLMDTPTLEISFTNVPASCPETPDGMGEVIVNGGTAPYSYTWENGGNEASQENLLPGSYLLTLTDDNGCSLIDTLFITSPSDLQLDSLIITPPSCEGRSNGMITALTSGGTAPYIYEWEEENQQNPIEGIAAGFYDLKITDDKGCAITVDNIQLTEPSALTAQIQKEDVACFGEATGMAAAIPMGGTPPYSYRWSDGKNQEDSIAIALMEGIYEVSIADQNGCEEIASTNIVQPEEALSVNITQMQIGCVGNNNSAATIEATGGTGDYSYNWGGLDNNTPTANGLDADTYFITVTDQNSCSVESNITIEALENIAVNLISQEPSCFNTRDGSITITSISGGNGEGAVENYNFQWNTQATTPQINNLVGDSIYQLTVTDNGNCSQVIERFLDGPPEITLNYDLKDVACFEENSGIIAITGTSSNDPITMYKWDHLSSPSNEATLEAVSAGDYRLTATTANGCDIVQDFTIEQPPALQINNPIITPNQCFNDQKGSIKFNIEGGNNDYTFQWSNAAATPSLENLNQGIYQVTILDGNDCSIEETFTIEGPDSLMGAITASPTSCFEDQDGQIEIQATGGTAPYLYKLGGSRYQASNQFLGLEAGAYATFIQDANGCIWENEATAINPGDVVLLEIVPEKEILSIGDSTILTAFATSQAGSVQLSWSSTNSEPFRCLDENCERISVQPLISTNFDLYAIDGAGCEAETSFFLRLSNPKKVFVPTGFSPNEDGMNDILLIHGQANITVKSFQIYDRWGEEVYAAFDFSIGDNAIFWDGTFRGQALNSGIYTWIMEVEYIDQQREIFKGNTTLIK